MKKPDLFLFIYPYINISLNISVQCSSLFTTVNNNLQDKDKVLSNKACERNSMVRILAVIYFVSN